MFRRLVRILTIGVLSVAAYGGFTELRADRGGCRPVRPQCICPLVFAPVVCERGCTYSNACFAECAGATGCIPTAGDPE